MKPSIFKPATSGFTVQERQVSGAPSWPSAAVNRAVAARVGTSNVAVCTAPTRLEINGGTVNLANGSEQFLPDGASVALNGNVYLIQDGERELRAGHGATWRHTACRRDGGPGPMA